MNLALPDVELIAKTSPRLLTHDCLSLPCCWDWCSWVQLLLGAGFCFAPAILDEGIDTPFTHLLPPPIGLCDSSLGYLKLSYAPHPGCQSLGMIHWMQVFLNSDKQGSSLRKSRDPRFPACWSTNFPFCHLPSASFLLLHQTFFHSNSYLEKFCPA